MLAEKWGRWLGFLAKQRAPSSNSSELYPLVAFFLLVPATTVLAHVWLMIRMAADILFYHVRYSSTDSGVVEDPEVK